MENQDLKTEEQNELLRRNLELSEKILEETSYIKKYIKWQQVWATVRLLILVIPIILGLLYLPDFINGYLKNLSF
jgi:hypothetical protein